MSGYYTTEHRATGSGRRPAAEGLRDGEGLGVAGGLGEGETGTGVSVAVSVGGFRGAPLPTGLTVDQNQPPPPPGSMINGLTPVVVGFVGCAFLGKPWGYETREVRCKGHEEGEGVV